MFIYIMFGLVVILSFMLFIGRLFSYTRYYDDELDKKKGENKNDGKSND